MGKTNLRRIEKHPDSLLDLTFIDLASAILEVLVVIAWNQVDRDVALSIK